MIVPIRQFVLKCFIILAERFPKEEAEIKQSKFPPGWNEDRVRQVLEHYESQSQEEAAAEDEAAFEAPGYTVMEIPIEFVPAVRELIARHRAA